MTSTDLKSAGRPQDQPQPSVIEMQDVNLVFKSKTGTVQALKDINIDVRENAFVAVIGPSGCGKSTLLKIVSRVLPVTSGSVRLYGEPVEEATLGSKLSYVFQRPLLLPWRTAISNVLLPLEILHKRLKPHHTEKAREMLALTGLEQFTEKYPHELSGGMQQRVSLARALVTEPEVLLMDEPFSSLDEITRETMQEELLRIWQQTRNTILFVTHSIPEAVLLSDRVIVLSQRPGTIKEVIDVDLPRPRSETIRQIPRFREIADDLRNLLRSSEGSS